MTARGLAARLAWVVPALALIALTPHPARGFGDAGSFDPRVLLVGTTTHAAHPSAPPRWSIELEARTSAPARHRPLSVRADEGALLDEPFVYWSGDAAVAPLTSAEIAGLRRFVSVGGVMFVDDAAPASDGTPGPFGRSARLELARVLTDSTPITIGMDHVIFRSYYLLRRATGRIAGPPTLDAIVRSGKALVVLGNHDLGGALARSAGGQWELTASPGGEAQREQAVRLAVNIAMYVLCSNYKDDQVHAPFLMRRRAFAPVGEP